MKILVDSDALFALFVPTDSHHKTATDLISTLSDVEFVTTNLVIQETATVLSHKVTQQVSIEFLRRLPDLDITIFSIDEAIEKRAWEVFKKQTKKGTSFVDCANIACLEIYHFDRILSFDQAYPKELRRI